MGIDLLTDKNNKSILFTSLEPCFGCSLFITRTNIKKIYSALKDPHKGGIGDLKGKKDVCEFFDDIELVTEPFEDLADKSRKLMREFFLNKVNSKAVDLYV